MNRKSTSNQVTGETPPATQPQTDKVAKAESPRKNGGWQEIEARRERAALKASLADVWDEDFDLDDEILAELDHKAEFFTSQEDVEEEFDETDGDDDADEFFEDD